MQGKSDTPAFRPSLEPAQIVFHLPARHLQDWRDTQHLRLYRRIEETLGPLGARFNVVDRRLRDFRGGAAEAKAYQDGNLHLIENGHVQGPGILNGCVAYLPPFCHLDPQGVQAASRIGDATYDPAMIRHKPAMAFFHSMRERWVERRVSRRAQKEEHIKVQAGAIAVFLQGDFVHDAGFAHMRTQDMLREVCQNAGGRPVLVKPHPLAMEIDQSEIARAKVRGLDLIETHANVHDILAACAVTVSFGSAVALEGFLHRKPAILFGRSDFHHFCETVRKPGEFAAGLARALARPREGYAKYLTWYFKRNCLSLHSADFMPAVLQVFSDAGFPPERLGLALPADEGLSRPVPP